MKDGEDIQADLQQREEINTSKASPHRHKVYFYTLEHKKKYCMRHSLSLTW
jgi:hypothetical protein